MFMAIKYNKQYFEQGIKYNKRYFEQMDKAYKSGNVDKYRKMQAELSEYHRTGYEIRNESYERESAKKMSEFRQQVKNETEQALDKQMQPQTIQKPTTASSKQAAKGQTVTGGSGKVPSIEEFINNFESEEVEVLSPKNKPKPNKHVGKEVISESLDNVEDVAKKTSGPKVNKVDDALDGLTSTQKRMFKGMKIAGVAATTFIIGTGLLDASRKNKAEREAEEEKEKQLKEQEKKGQKKNKVRESVQKEYGKPPRMGLYTDINVGQTVIDAYNDRMGHTQMGNRDYTQLYRFD